MSKFVTRAYNSFKINEQNQSVLTKISHEKKLSDEIDYFKNLPNDLAIYFPRLVDSLQEEGNYQMDIEYYMYSNLGMKMLDDEFDPKFWESAFGFIMLYVDNYKKFEIEPYVKDSYDMFIAKTEREYKNLVDKFEFFNDLDGYDKFLLNGKELHSFNTVWKTNKAYMETQPNFLDQKRHLIHGDCCFSNMLCGTMGDQVVLKFIDPRGSFGSTKYYGDAYYDLAKISHSCNGGYEYFINDRFKIEADKNVYSLQYDNSNKEKVNAIFQEHLKGYDPIKVKMLEGTIFVGMCARHYDSLDRQKAMFITGLKILNEVYEEILLRS